MCHHYHHGRDSAPDGRNTHRTLGGGPGDWGAAPGSTPRRSPGHRVMRAAGGVVCADLNFDRSWEFFREIRQAYFALIFFVKGERNHITARIKQIFEGKMWKIKRLPNRNNAKDPTNHLPPNSVSRLLPVGPRWRTATGYRWRRARTSLPWERHSIWTHRWQGRKSNNPPSNIKAPKILNAPWGTWNFDPKIKPGGLQCMLVDGYQNFQWITQTL